MVVRFTVESSSVKFCDRNNLPFNSTHAGQIIRLCANDFQTSAEWTRHCTVQYRYSVLVLSDAINAKRLCIYVRNVWYNYVVAFYFPIKRGLSLARFGSGWFPRNFVAHYATKPFNDSLSSFLLLTPLCSAVYSTKINERKVLSLSCWLGDEAFNF